MAKATTAATSQDTLKASLATMERRALSGDPTLGLPTGFTGLDVVTSGLQPGELIVIGGRPGTGKTTLATNIATHASMVERMPTMFFSPGTSDTEITNRMLCAEARVDTHQLRNAALTDDEWAKLAMAGGRIADAQLWIHDDPDLTVDKIRTEATALAAEIGYLGLIVVDYLQIMTGPSDLSRHEQLSEIVRQLKILARELDCPIVLASQLSRRIENRYGNWPDLADLSDSSGIEQHSDVVIFVNHYEETKSGITQPAAELIFGKHRGGSNRIVKLAWNPQIARFDNLPATSKSDNA